MGIQTLKTETGDELIVMSRRDYDSLLAQLGDEEAEDRMTLLIAAEARSEAALPEPVCASILAGDSVLRALRKWRGLTQVDLAQGAGLTQGYVSEIEARAKSATPEALAKLALALNVPAAWLG